MFQSAPRSKGHRGFSVIEMIIAIVMVAILVGAGAPSIARQITHSRVNRAATVLAGDLELAQSLAARQRQPVRVTVDPSSLDLTITDRATTLEIIKRPYGTASEYRLASLTSTATVDMLPHGVASSAVTYTLGIGSYTRRVTMSRAGHVRVEP